MILNEFFGGDAFKKKQEKKLLSIKRKNLVDLIFERVNSEGCLGLVPEITKKELRLLDDVKCLLMKSNQPVVVGFTCIVVDDVKSTRLKCALSAVSHYYSEYYGEGFCSLTDVERKDVFIEMKDDICGFYGMGNVKEILGENNKGGDDDGE